MIGRGRLLALVAVFLVAAIVVMRLAQSAPEEEDLDTDVAVHVDAIGRATLHRYVYAYGTVEPEPALSGRPAAGALITPFADGVLASIECVEGLGVARGDVLFRLDSRMAEVEVSRARADADFAEQAFERQEGLLATDGTSRRAYQEALQQRDVSRAALAGAETALAYLSISAPLSGTVIEITARVGQHVDATTALARVVDLSRLVVGVRVPQRELGDVRVGQRVLIGPDDRGVEGTVRVLGSAMDPSDGTYRVVVSVPPGSGFLPGQFTEARIVVEERPDVLVVPEVSVVRSTEEGSWIVLVDGDRAVRLPVTIGLRDGGWVEVQAEGLAQGMRVVTDDAYSLPEETRIHIVGG